MRALLDYLTHADSPSMVAMAAQSARKKGKLKADPVWVDANKFTIYQRREVQRGGEAEYNAPARVEFKPGSDGETTPSGAWLEWTCTRALCTSQGSSTRWMISQLTSTLIARRWRLFDLRLGTGTAPLRRPG